MSQKVIKRMTGYKATNADMSCRDVAFEIGKWYEVKGDLEMCGNGFHFCDHWSGVWGYYGEGSRVFRVEAEEVLDLPVNPGADHKRVARRIRLIEEAPPTDGNWNSGYGNSGNWNSGNGNSGDGNSGNWNSGYGNSGYRNSGNGNSGNRNSGDGNSGYGNSGNWNSGNGNSGYRNSGNGNSGYRNSGDGNSGNRNSGNWNSGDGNSGNWNSGYGNRLDRSSGVFCIIPEFVRVFDNITNMTYDDLFRAHPECYELGNLLASSEPIDFERFKTIPNITPEKLKALHDAHLAWRSK
jgi:hypothetical protein